MEPLPIDAYLLPAALGIGLAAATGFRVFLPLLITGLAARYGYVPVSDGFSWIAGTSALMMLGIAAMIEITAYYVPLLDNLLDTIAVPAALIAGIAVSAAVMTDLPPMLKWTLAIIAGGGAAGLTQGATTILRGASTATTAGLGNPIIATGEILGAIAVSVLAIAAPWIAIAAVVVFCIVIYRVVRRIRRNRPVRKSQ
jgi:hypothetical protein